MNGVIPLTARWAIAAGLSFNSLIIVTAAVIYGRTISGEGLVMTLGFCGTLLSVGLVRKDKA